MNAQRARKQPRLALDDFDEMLFDRPEHEKWELIDGQLLKSMVGARWEHHVIISNIDLAISNHLRAAGQPCRVFRETFFLRKVEDELAALPDILVRCGKLAPDVTSVDDPMILMEVVSPTSEGRDRTLKRAAYQRLSSLQHYVLVSRDHILVDHYARSEEGWRDAEQLDKADHRLRLAAIDFEMTLADIYRDVLAAG